MKKFEFPINIPSLYIFVGKEEWSDFCLKCEHQDPDFDIDAPVPNKGEGRLENNVLWLEEVEWSLITHEMQHFLDWCFMIIDIPTELEFRAFLASMYNSAVIEWAIEKMKEDIS